MGEHTLHDLHETESSKTFKIKDRSHSFQIEAGCNWNADSCIMKMLERTSTHLLILQIGKQRLRGRK